jgi:hypothetical protein
MRKLSLPILGLNNNSWTCWHDVEVYVITRNDSENLVEIRLLRYGKAVCPSRLWRVQERLYSYSSTAVINGLFESNLF